jgi:hypothetical protein
MYFHGFDSIFFLALLEQRLYLIDSAGNLKKKYNLATTNAYVQLGTIYPAILKDNSLYFCTTPSPNLNTTKENFAEVKLDLLNGAVQNIFPLSPKYDEGWWGRHHYLRISHTYNPLSDKIIVSYPNDHFISSINQDQEAERYLAPAKKINKLKPVHKKYEETEDDIIYRHETKQGS